MKRADSHPSRNCEHSAMYLCDGGEEEPEVASAYRPMLRRQHSSQIECKRRSLEHAKESSTNLLIVSRARSTPGLTVSCASGSGQWMWVHWAQRGLEDMGLKNIIKITEKDELNK